MNALTRRPPPASRLAFTLGRAAVLLAFTLPIGAAEPPAIYVAGPDGEDPVRLFRFGDFDGQGSPDWSDDGERIAFHAWRPGRGETSRDSRVVTVAADGSQPLDLGPGALPSWSPYGSRLTFSSFDPQGVYVMNADGSDRRLIDASGWSSRWSPDGRTIAYIVHRDGRADFCLHDLETGRKRYVFEGASPYNVIDRSFSWSPDSRGLAFVGVRKGGEREIATYLVEPLPLTVVPLRGEAGDGKARAEFPLTVVPFPGEAGAEFPLTVVPLTGEAGGGREAGAVAIDIPRSPLSMLEVIQQRPSNAAVAWHPQGLRVLFVKKDADGRDRLYRHVFDDASDPEPLSGLPEEFSATPGDWSPDWSRLLFIGFRTDSARSAAASPAQSQRDTPAPSSGGRRELGSGGPTDDAGTVGDTERSLPKEFAELVDAWRAARDADQRSKLEDGLRDALEKTFEAREAVHGRELESLEAALRRLGEELGGRSGRHDEIADGLLRELLRGGPERQDDAKVRRLLDEWQAARGDEARAAEAEKRLREAVAESFDRREAARREKFDALETQVARLRGEFDARRAHRDEIIEAQLQNLLREAQGLGWPGDPQQGPSRLISKEGAFDASSSRTPNPTPAAVPAAVFNALALAAQDTQAGPVSRAQALRTLAKNARGTAAAADAVMLSARVLDSAADPVERRAAAIALFVLDGPNRVENLWRELTDAPDPAVAAAAGELLTVVDLEVLTLLDQAKVIPPDAQAVIRLGLLELQLERSIDAIKREGTDLGSADPFAERLQPVQRMLDRLAMSGEGVRRLVQGTEYAGQTVIFFAPELEMPAIRDRLLVRLAAVVPTREDISLALAEALSSQVEQTRKAAAAALGNRRQPSFEAVPPGPTSPSSQPAFRRAGAESDTRSGPLPEHPAVGSP